jgi:hypothetical protein
MSYNVFDVLSYWPFFVCVSYNDNITFLFSHFQMDIYHVMVCDIL